MERINRDTHEVSGTDLEGFKEAVKKMSAITHCRRINAKDLAFIHYTGKEHNGQYVISDLSRTALKRPSQTISGLSPSYTDEEAMRENKTTTRLLAIAEAKDGSEDLLHISSYGLPSLLQSIYLSGEAAFDNNSYYRNAFLASVFYQKKAEAGLSLITRKTCDNDEKIYYVGLSRYRYVPQADLLIPVLDRIAKDAVLGTMDVVSWSVDHALSQIYLEFPDAAKEIAESYKLPHEAMPGLMLQTSDIGRSSFIAQATMRINNHLVRLETVSVSHNNKKGVDVDEYINEFVDKVDTELFANIKKIPEQLCELMTMSISPAVIATDDDRENNYIAVTDILKESINKTFKKFSGSKKKVIFESLSEEIISCMSYTAYDIAEMIMAVPDRVHVDAVTAVTVNREAAKAPEVVKSVTKKYIKEAEKDFMDLSA